METPDLIARGGVDPSASVPPGLATPASVRIGPRAVLNPDLVIEDDVQIGACAVFAHEPGRVTTLRQGVVVGAGAVIGPGVEIGRGALLRPGAVVLASAPSNAVLEGNPAQIVGYRQSVEPASAALPGSPTRRPSVTPLGVGGAALHQMTRVADLRGALTVGEVGRDLPFEPRRWFMVFDVPSRELRGEHAHRRCHQFLICAHGSCRVLLDDGRARCELTLDSPDLGVHMPPMIWGTQYRYSADAVLLVLASDPYDPADYIRTYDEFLAEAGA